MPVWCPSPYTMFPLRMLLISSLPLLVLSSKAEQCSLDTSHHKSHVMASLKCYNDFTNQIRCTWEGEQHTPLYVSVNGIGEPCVSDDDLESNGKLTQSCVYKTKVFSTGSRDFFFNTSCPSKVTTINIAAQGKVLPPTEFSETKLNGGNRLLRWSSPYSLSSSPTLNLTYQLKYRRHDHEWILVDHINITHFEIESQKLLPGYSYEARVRARGPVGRWSDWSPKVEWMTEEDGVINLQCVIAEGAVICSWQVKKSEAQFLVYHLCGHNNGSSTKCVHCHSYAEHPYSGVLVDFECSLACSEPERLTVEIQSQRKAKSFSNTENIQPPPPSQLCAHKEDGIWKLKWSQSRINGKITVSYQVHIQSKDMKDTREFNLTEGDYSFDVPSLRHSTDYMARVRAIPGNEYAGRPSDWSGPEHFTTGPAPWNDTIIYVLIAVVVAVLFFILYKALPACHRRFVLWNVSIPSPINSKVLEGMSNKNFLAGEAHLYTGNEKTSVFIIQTSDNPTICKGSISEFPLLTCSDDADMGLSMSKSEWPQGSRHSSYFIEGSRMTDKSGVSFTGPYILCREDSSVPVETSDTVFSSLISFDDVDGRYVSESPNEFLPIKGGYVLSPPKNTSSECSTPINNHANEKIEPRKSELPNDDPPAYTPRPTARSSAIVSHPSGYCLMPNMESLATWMSASATPPEGNTERKLQEIDGNSPERSYVTLSQRGL